MSPEFLARIFEPFTQESPGARSSYEGTGLGMSIAKKLVDAMGGTIEVSSRVGEGSTFQITIPFEVAQAPGGEGAGDGLLCADEGAGSDARAAKKPAQPQVDLAGMNLPMAEDNELNAEIASTLRGRAVPVR